MAGIADLQTCDDLLRKLEREYAKRGLHVRLEAMAKARGIAPSRLVQEILWKAVHERQGS